MTTESAASSDPSADSRRRGRRSRGRLVEAGLDRAGALARPVAQRRIRTALGDGLVVRERGVPCLQLLVCQAPPRERAEAHAGLDLGDGVHGLERLDRGLLTLLLELGLADQQPRL